MTNNREHFLNYESMEKAIEVANNLNDLASKGNNFMNCNLYRYSAGPARKTDSMTDEQAARMGGVYRELK